MYLKMNSGYRENLIYIYVQVWFIYVYVVNKKKLMNLKINNIVQFLFI